MRLKKEPSDKLEGLLGDVFISQDLLVTLEGLRENQRHFKLPEIALETSIKGSIDKNNIRR